MSAIKLRSERKGDHVHQQVFVGPDRDHFALAGTLVMGVGEWQEFGAALALGAERMKMWDGTDRLTVDFGNETEVVR